MFVGWASVFFPPSQFQAFLTLCLGTAMTVVSLLWVQRRVLVVFTAFGFPSIILFFVFFSSRLSAVILLSSPSGTPGGAFVGLIFCTRFRVLMDMKIKHLGRALRLTEDEGSGLPLSDELWQESTDDGHLFLVGRLLVNRDVNFEGLVRSLKGMMNPVNGMDIKALPQGWFPLRFHHAIDKHRILAGCPWSFEKNLIILNDVPANADPIHVDLNWCDFVVHVHDLPLSKMMEGVVRHVGNCLGLFKELETDEHGHAWGGNTSYAGCSQYQLFAHPGFKTSYTVRGGACDFVHGEHSVWLLALGPAWGRVVRRLELEQSGSARSRLAGVRRGKDIFGSFQQGPRRDSGVRSESSMLEAEGQRNGGDGHGVVCGDIDGLQQHGDKRLQDPSGPVFHTTVEACQSEAGQSLFQREGPPGEGLTGFGP
ncbi:hypothetical protein Salat_1655700 [Sesamum alatum]|uniref:DUF4283 domain-containing protein n=1 Tax=Sesamum alatum TaxID=300844 RepID=A0AAE1Y7H0_9LAMI|nr:hypothetical protein Salat_1655700 [Sesamum alatum]